MIARALGVVVVLLLVLVGAAEAGTWIVISPDWYYAGSGWWAAWHKIRHWNAWVVVAAYDNKKECIEHADRRLQEGTHSLRSDKPHPRTDEEWQAWVISLQLAGSRCLPIELAEKIGNLHVDPHSLR